MDRSHRKDEWGDAKRMRAGRFGPWLLLFLLALNLGARASDTPASARWPVALPGHRSPAASEHPRLFFRRSDIPALRARAATPEGRAIVARLRLLLGGGEAMPSHYSAATRAYERSEDLEARSEMPGDAASGAAEPATGKRTAADDLFDEILTDGQPGVRAAANTIPRPPWAREGASYALGRDLPVGAYTISHAAGFGFLYVLTGETRYAALARECVELAWAGQRDRDDRYAWTAPGGMLRAGPSLACYAMAYDLCHDAWPEDFRRECARRIQAYDGGNTDRDGGARMTLAALCLEPRMFPASNHYGMQAGGATMALLAIRGDPGTDPALLDRWLGAVTENTRNLFTEGYAGKGYYKEGHHPARMTAAWILPALQARRMVLGEDWVTGNENARFMSVRWLYEVVRQDSRLACNMFGRYADPSFVRGDLNSGDFALGFGNAPAEFVPAMKWFYETVIDPRPVEARDYDALLYPHHAILAFVNWPLDVTARNPGAVLPKVWHDPIKGHTVFRNGWRADGRDMVVTVSAGTRTGAFGIDSGGPVSFIAQGRRGELACDFTKAGATSYLRVAEDGSGILSATPINTYLGVDFSRASGADALVVMTGRRAGRAKPPYGRNPDGAFLLDNGWRVYLNTFQDGPPPVARVEAGRLHVGGQVVTFEQGRFVFGVMADGPPPYVNESHFQTLKPPEDGSPDTAALARATQQREALQAAREALKAGQTAKAQEQLQMAIRLGAQTPEGREAGRLFQETLMKTDAADPFSLED